MFRANHVSKLGFCMENNQAIEAANLIASLYRGETTLERLPEACRPKSIADAQQILSELPKSLDRPVQGYKCYFPFKATQPNLFAPIFNILPNGSPITSEVANLHLIEPEILFRAERDLPPREEAYSYEEVASAVVAVPAFEFLATRFSADFTRSEEHTSELQSLMRISYAVFCLKKKTPIPSNFSA